MRRNVVLLFALSIVVNVGMWMERLMIVVSSLRHDFMPSAWGLFIPTLWDWLILLGSICIFAWLFLAFMRVLPAISISEMRELVRESAKGAGMSVPAPALWGLLAEFASAEALARRGAAPRATRATRQAEAYAPFAVEGLAEALGFTPLARRRRRRWPAGCSAASAPTSCSGMRR